MGNASGSSSQGGSMANEEHDPPVVRRVQQALKQQGFDVGSIDGQMGPETEGALRQFQQSKGLTQSGNLDQQTLSALGVEQNGSQSQGSSSQGPSSQGNASRGAMGAGSTSMGATEGSQQGQSGSQQSPKGSQSNGASTQGSAYK